MAANVSEHETASAITRGSDAHWLWADAMGNEHWTMDHTPYQLYASKHWNQLRDSRMMHEDLSAISGPPFHANVVALFVFRFPVSLRWLALLIMSCWTFFEPRPQHGHGVKTSELVVDWFGSRHFTNKITVAHWTVLVIRVRDTRGLPPRYTTDRRDCFQTKSFSLMSLQINSNVEFVLRVSSS